MSSDPDRTARLPADDPDDATAAQLTPRSGRGPQFAPGTLVAGRYRISSILGAGGMGEVYRAEDGKLGQTVALKFLPPALARDSGQLEQLLEEVRVGRQIAHPNVCRIYDIGEWGVAHFVAMEYVDGEDLARLLRRIRRLPHDTAVHIARGIAAGLGAAHAKRIIHRDLKPANVMIDGAGDARIADFGLAIAAEAGADAALAGTPAYMAPEQLAGAPATMQSDLYALGLVMYEMFTGRRANEGLLPTEPRASREKTEIVRPSSYVRELDPHVERIILRCLERDPSRRPASVREVLDGLPGADPLAAAIAAGQTPSPRVVAAAGAEGTIRAAYAWTWFAALVVVAASWAVVRGSRGIINHQRPEKPAVVMQDRAREMLRSFGLAPHRRQSIGYEWHLDFLAWMTSRVAPADVWPAIERGPAVYVFWMRDAMKALTPAAVSPAATPRDPPEDRGMSEIELDRKGRLVALRADPDVAGQRAVDWRPLLTAAGFDPAALTPATPRTPPPVYADARAAWTGTYPDDARVPMTIEAAMRGGTPVYFALSGPWTHDGATERMPFNSAALTVLVTSIVVAAVVFALVLAWRNARAKRIDRNGASRLAAFVAIVAVASFVIGGDHALDFGHEVALFSHAISDAAFWAAIYSLLYLAIEPFARRRWPELLISWARLLAGGLRDPLVGRDILLGISGGFAHTLLAGLTPHNRLAGRLHDLLGLRFGIASLFDATTTSLLDGLVVITLLVGLTMLLRRRALGVAALFIIFAVAFIVALREPSLIGFGVAIALLLTLVATRGGLLALVVTQFVFHANFSSPVPSSPDDWYLVVGLLPLAATMALAAYGARCAAEPGVAAVH